jgi:hypothetical protein
MCAQLESLALSYVQNYIDGPLLDSQKQALDHLCSLIRGESPSDAVSSSFRSAFGTDQPVQKILAILQMSPEPIPCGARPPAENSNGQRQKARTWTEYEDQRLISGIHKYGLDNWHQVCEFVGNGRTRSQCAQRWNRGLNPQIIKGPWSAQDEDELIALVAKHGEKSWKKIANQFGNRSDVQCRYHYQQLQKGVVRKPVKMELKDQVAQEMMADARIVFDEMASEFAVLREREVWRDSYLPDPLSWLTTDAFGASLSIDD